jgi:hypothetical protein
MANKQVAAMPILGVMGAPSFDVVQVPFDASSVVHFRSSPESIHDVFDHAF